jgi:hypothetical protein
LVALADVLALRRVIRDGFGLHLRRALALLVVDVDVDVEIDFGGRGDGELGCGRHLRPRGTPRCSRWLDRRRGARVDVRNVRRRLVFELAIVARRHPALDIDSP